MGVMKESINQEAVLEDVDEHVFLGFCEFAYRSIYTTPTLEEQIVNADMVVEERLKKKF